MNRLKPVNVMWGTDPEGFFARNGRIVGSEKVLPEGGLGGPQPHVVLDGVQFELNPGARITIPALAGQVTLAFRSLYDVLKKVPDISVNFSGVVEVDRKELDSLSDKSRILGCQPSKNVYGVKPITVDVATYRKRSAGGHIHMGLGETNLFNEVADERQRLVPLHDIFVGNTGVLIDRDPGAAERRENYGRAGEYRLPDYGLEYRTLSNFWLRDYALMSLMFGMAHLAIATLSQSMDGESFEDELVEVVNIQKVIEAIDTNNYYLARENWNTIVPFLQRHLPDYGFPFTPATIHKFLVFTDAAYVKGIESFFPENPLLHWVGEQRTTFTSFMEGING